MKKKILAAALVGCLVAVLSLGSLAWFTDNDSVKNTFQIANSTEDPDDIFSVDVWEDKTPEDDTNDTDPTDKEDVGITYDDVLPGDTHAKEAHIENTGYYDQYIRATVTVTGASVWQDVYDTYMVDLTEFVDIDMAIVEKQVAFYDSENDAFVYELYLKDILVAGTDIVLFENVSITKDLTRYQAAELSGEFNINVMADAVQTENVGDTAYDAFNTVGMVLVRPISNATELNAALASDEAAHLIVDANALTDNTLTIDSAIENKTIDFNGQDAIVNFSANATADNVVISGIVDTDGNGYSVVTDKDFTGDVTITNCSLKDAANKGCIYPAGGNVTIDDCQLEGTGKSYGVRANGKTGDLIITNTTFENFGSWAILVNGTQDGNLTVDYCTFKTEDGVLKTLGGGVTGDFTFTNNTMIGVKGHDGDSAKILVSGSGSSPVIAAGTKTVTGNTLDGVAWTQ